MAQFFEAITSKAITTKSRTSINSPRSIGTGKDFSCVEILHGLKGQILLLDHCHDLIMSFYRFPLLLLNIVFMLALCVGMYLTLDGILTNIDLLSAISYGMMVPWTAFLLLILHFSADIFRTKVRHLMSQLKIWP